MASYQNIKKIAGEPVEHGLALQHLEELYRETYIDMISRHFRGMLDQLSNPEPFIGCDSRSNTLRLQRAVLSQLFNNHGEHLAQRFEESLLAQYRVSVATLLNGEAIVPSRDFTAGRDELRSYLARATRGIGARHGSIVLSLGYSFTGLMGSKSAELPRPWAEAGLLSALDEALGHLQPTLAPEAEMAIFESFVNSVLRHLGDACRAFRDALPNDLDVCEPRHPPAQKGEEGPLSGTAPVTTLLLDSVGANPREKVLDWALLAPNEIAQPARFRLCQTWLAVMLTLFTLGAAGWLIYPDAGQGWASIAEGAHEWVHTGGIPVRPLF